MSNAGRQSVWFEQHSAALVEWTMVHGHIWFTPFCLSAGIRSERGIAKNFHLIWFHPLVWGLNGHGERLQMGSIGGNWNIWLNFRHFRLTKSSELNSIFPSIPFGCAISCVWKTTNRSSFVIKHNFYLTVIDSSHYGLISSQIASLISK